MLLSSSVSQFVIIIVVGSIAAALSAPRIERLDQFHALVCNEQTPECTCHIPPVGNSCDVCCTVDDHKINCSTLCPINAKKVVDASRYEDEAKKVADAYQQLESNVTTIPTTNLKEANETNIPLPVTLVEGGGDVAEEEPMLTAQEEKPPELEKLPAECQEQQHEGVHQSTKESEADEEEETQSMENEMMIRKLQNVKPRFREAGRQAPLLII